MAQPSISALAFEYVREAIDYNPTSGEMVWRIRPRSHFPTHASWGTWNTRWAGKRIGTLNRIKGYYTTMLCGRRYTLHRLAWCLSYESWPPHEIDHINGNRLDNRLVNLRAVTRQENGRNLSRASNNTSGVTGVSWNKLSERWHAYIMVDKKMLSLGLFTDFDTAVNARKKAETLHGFSVRHGGQCPLMQL